MPDHMVQNKEGLVLPFALPSKNASQQSTLSWHFGSKQLLCIQSLHACKQKGGQRRKLIKTQVRAGREWNKSYCVKIIPEDESQRWRRTFCNRAHALIWSSNSFVSSKKPELPCREAVLYLKDWSALHTTQDLSFEVSMCRRGAGEAVLWSSRNKLHASVQQQGVREAMAITSGQAGSWFSCTLQGKSSTK